MLIKNRECMVFAVPLSSGRDCFDTALDIVF